MAANITGLTVLVIGLLACDVTGASRILLLSTPHRSMMIYFMAAGEALQEAGHDVYMLVSEVVTPSRHRFIEQNLLKQS